MQISPHTKTAPSSAGNTARGLAKAQKGAVTMADSQSITRRSTRGVPRPQTSGPLNGNWQGGRSIASNGYVLIRVGATHPLADVRGYAYEHRLVASAKIGRWLKPEEQVHHIDGNKQNNSPDNLLACTSLAEHQVEHRRVGLNRRLPGEENPIVECACGCGASFERFDATKRPRRYLPGHNIRPVAPSSSQKGGQ